MNCNVNILGDRCQRGHDPQVENCWVPGWYTTSDHLVSIWLQFFTYIENLNCIGIIKVIWKPCLYQHEQLMYFWGRFRNEQEARKAKADYIFNTRLFYMNNNNKQKNKSKWVKRTGKYKLPLPNSGQLSQEKSFKYSYEQQVSHFNFNLNFKFKSKGTQISF